MYSTVNSCCVDPFVFPWKLFKWKLFLFLALTPVKKRSFLSYVGSVINGPLNTTTHTNVNLEDTSNNLDDGQDIGVIGKGKSIRFN